MKNLLTLSFALFLSLSAFATQQLSNQIGEGVYPAINLTLSKNEAGWNPYTINYAHTGGIPSPGDSLWVAQDTEGNTYGTFELISDGTNVSCAAGIYQNQCYVGDTAHYFSHVNFSPNPPGSGTFQLTVKTIIGGGGGVATPAVYKDTGQPIILSTQAADIVNDRGQKIILKGVVRPSLEWNPQGQYLTATDFKNMAAFGANVVRLDLNQSYWLDLKNGPAYQKVVDETIYNAIQNHMAVILDLHWLTQNQAPMANADSITFWTQVASKYKNFGTIIFELYNEPHLPNASSYDDQKNIWLNGGTYEGQNYVGYQKLYDSVRGVGANNLILINGLDFGYDVSFVNDNFKINGTNILYGSHPYDDRGSDGYQGQGGSLANNFAWILGKYPILFTEFGDNIPADYPQGVLSNHDSYTRNLNFLNTNGGSYTAFAWWVGDPAFPTIISSWSSENHNGPINGGQDIYDDLMKNPPTPLK